MANRREKQNRRQRLRNLRNGKIQRQGIIDSADFISSMPDEDEIRPRMMDGADFINSTSDEKVMEGADLINSMPDEILHYILSFLPIELAMRTCVLSKRWRYVWCETPSLDIDGDCIYKAKKIKQNLVSYKAPRIISFKLCLGIDNRAADIDSWLEFAISRNVQNLCVKIFANMMCGVNLSVGKTYKFPDFFYRCSSLKQLSVSHEYDIMKPRCIVSWKSLRKLSLRCCKLGDKSMNNILSGCPILESLTLYGCRLLERLDLSKSPSIWRLEIDRSVKRSGPIVIVAPHIHYLSLTNSIKPFSLVDVSSLTEASLDICIVSTTNIISCQCMAIGMLAKSRNLERLTLGPSFLKVLSLAELRCAPFPTLNVQTLIIKTEFVRSIIPGVARLLLNSPGLKKLIVDTMKLDLNKRDICLEHYSDLQGLNPHRCWRSEYEFFPTYTMLGCNDATLKLLASFMELVLRNSKTLEMMVVWLGGIYFNDDEQWFEELLQMAGTLSHNNNVSIVLKRNNYFKY